MVEAEVRDVRPLVKMFNKDYEMRLSRRTADGGSSSERE